MRQNSKNNRGRGRGRKGPNPLTRSYESNGPDVKVRGTAQHIADKYLSLARDALSSGDGVAAENYFQHAEHYNRIIMTAQAQQNAAREEQRQSMAENAEQPAIAVEPANDTNDPQKQPQPTITQEAAATDSEANGAEVVNGEEKPKPRRQRRAPSRTRRGAEAENGSATAAEGDAGPGEVSEKIADNPPAFLMSD